MNKGVRRLSGGYQVSHENGNPGCYLTTIGLLLRIPLTAFVAWFIFIGPGIAEFTHFIFPLVTPALEPTNPAPITAVINGVRITDMANHHFAVTGKYYFPGLYTAIYPDDPRHLHRVVALEEPECSGLKIRSGGPPSVSVRCDPKDGNVFDG